MNFSLAAGWLTMTYSGPWMIVLKMGGWVEMHLEYHNADPIIVHFSCQASESPDFFMLGKYQISLWLVSIIFAILDYVKPMKPCMFGWFSSLAGFSRSWFEAPGAQNRRYSLSLIEDAPRSSLCKWGRARGGSGAETDGSRRRWVHRSPETIFQPARKRQRR